MSVFPDGITWLPIWKKAISIIQLLQQKYFLQRDYCVRNYMESTEVVHGDEIFISILNKTCGIMF